MLQRQETIEDMADEAKRQAGWDNDDDPTRYRPLDPDADLDQQREHRAYAEGVEAGLRWALSAAGDPFDRRRQ